MSNLTSEYTISRSTPARKLPKEQWDMHRKLIEAIYPVKGITAKDVIILLNARGLTVTERQFKRKVQDWKLEKNIKKTEMKLIVHKQQQRRIERGKETIFRVRGRSVPQAKIERYQKRDKHGSSEDTSASPALSVFSYETPSESGEASLDNDNHPMLVTPKVLNHTIDLVHSCTSPYKVVESSEHASRKLLYRSSLQTPLSPLCTRETLPKDHVEELFLASSTRTQQQEQQPVSMHKIPRILPIYDTHKPPIRPMGILRVTHVTIRQLQQTYGLLRASQGPTHAKTLECLVELGHCMIDEGRSASAEAVLVSEISRMENFGADNFSGRALTLRLHLVIVRSQIRQMQGAKALPLLRALLDDASSLPMHSSVLIEVMLSYGNCLFARGVIAPAEVIFRNAIRTGGEFLPPDNYLMLNAFRLLAKSLYKQGKSPEAEKILRVVTQSPHAAVGVNNRISLGVFADLSLVFRVQGKLTEAEQLLTAVVNQRFDILGPDHTVTLLGQIELAFVIAEKHADYTSLRNTCCQITSVLGHSHWLSTYARRGLAHYVSLSSQWNEAEVISEQVLLDCMVAELPALEQYTTWRMLGSIYHMQGRLDKSILMYERAFAWGGREFGLGHPDVKCIWSDLGEVIQEKIRAKSLSSSWGMDQVVDREVEQ